MHRDWPLGFFALAALASLVVSLPATSAAMALTHGDGWWWVAVGVFELGAVGLELMTLAVPQWRKRLLAGTVVLLTLTTGANYAAGADHLQAATLAPGSTYAAIRAAGYGWALALGLSALFPALLFAFLLGLTARWRMLARWQAADVALALREQEVTRQVADVARREADLARQVTPIVVAEPPAPDGAIYDIDERVARQVKRQRTPRQVTARDTVTRQKRATPAQAAEVKRLVAQGLSASEAARRVGVKPRTAQRYVQKEG